MKKNNNSLVRVRVDKYSIGHNLPSMRSCQGERYEGQSSIDEAYPSNSSTLLWYLSGGSTTWTK